MTALIKQLQTKHETISDEIAKIGNILKSSEMAGADIDEIILLLDDLNKKTAEALKIGDCIRALVLLRISESN